VEVTVANRGNEPEVNIVVDVQLLQLGDEGETIRLQAASATVAALAAGEATALTFDEFVVNPGPLHEVVVTAVLEGDEDIGSNEVRQVFYRNESA
jgi:hypothetical protein